MADGSKRQSTGTKVQPATPDLSLSNSVVPSETVLRELVGARIRLTTSLSQTLTGTVFTVCPITKLLAINTASPPPTPSSSAREGTQQPGDYHVLPISSIRSFNHLSKAPSGDGESLSPSGFENMNPQMSKVDLRALKAREEAAIAKLQAAERRKGKGVGVEGQMIFDALSRTLPTRWHEQSIIVLDAVIIAPPYRVEDCKAPADKQTALTRVKKVLEMERKKLPDRSKMAPAVGNNSAVPGELRKGG